MQKSESKIDKIKKSGKEIKNEISQQVVGYIGAGFGLIASLAWNEAIKALIEHLFPLEQDTVWAKFMYAGIMTIVLILVTIYLVRIFKLQNQEDTSKE